MSRNIVILGSTGSIGKSALKVTESLDNINILGITANTSIEPLIAQIEKYRPAYAAVSCPGSFDALKSRLGSGIPTKLLKGHDGICELASMKQADVVVNGLAGIAGLRPAVEGLRSGKRMALANKESIVMGWNVIKEAFEKGEKKGAQLIPVDSEHSALFQLIRKEDIKDISRLIITASGGAVYGKTLQELEKVTIEECLRHPTWNMGHKITVDSATLMNKGLEIIEAHFLFGLPLERISVLIHPQSVIHGMAEFVDGSIMAHMGAADMKIPIQYALTYPRRAQSPTGSLSIDEISSLKLSLPDEEKFPCLSIARNAAGQGGMKNIQLCAADEVAVEAFSEGKLRFTQIPDFIQETLKSSKDRKTASVKDIEGAYEESKVIALKKLKEEFYRQ